jgi:predicted N-formylglutamate amidohydrolase
MKSKALIISCEHAVNTIPVSYQPLFEHDQHVLDTHHAIDLGALTLAKGFSEAFNCPLVQATVSRLLIDCNRSLNHPRCFSTFTQSLPEKDKQSIINRYYRPYRDQLEDLVKQSLSQGKSVIHLSMHSFTPVLKSVTRNAEIGLLYDPQRQGERQLATIWRQHLRHHSCHYRVRMNYPYRGSSDGFTSSLRKQLTESDYLGLEVEANQSLTASSRDINLLLNALQVTFESAYPVLEQQT